MFHSLFLTTSSHVPFSPSAVSKYSERNTFAGNDIILNTIWLIMLSNNFLFFRFITHYGLFISSLLEDFSQLLCLSHHMPYEEMRTQIFYFYLITIFQNCKHKSHSFASSVNLTTLFVGCYSVKITAVTMCKNKIKLSNM